MNEEIDFDIKELNREKGLIQKLADAENRLGTDDRKEQMAVAIKASKLIIDKVKEQQSKKETPKQEVSEVFNSSKLAEEIKREIGDER